MPIPAPLPSQGPQPVCARARHPPPPRAPHSCMHTSTRTPPPHFALALCTHGPAVVLWPHLPRALRRAPRRLARAALAGPRAGALPGIPVLGLRHPYPHEPAETGAHGFTCASASGRCERQVRACRGRCERQVREHAVAGASGRCASMPWQVQVAGARACRGRCAWQVCEHAVAGASDRCEHAKAVVRKHARECPSLGASLLCPHHPGPQPGPTEAGGHGFTCLCGLIQVRMASPVRVWPHPLIPKEPAARALTRS